jgi:hypothetical protein
MASTKKKLSKVHQEEAKQSSKIGLLRDNRSDMFDSYWCDGGTYWSRPIGIGDPRGDKVGGTSPMELGVLVLPSPPNEDIAAY